MYNFERTSPPQPPKETPPDLAEYAAEKETLMQDIADLENELRQLYADFSDRNHLVRTFHLMAEKVAHSLGKEEHLPDDFGRMQKRMDEIENILLPQLRSRLDYINSLLN